MKSLRGGIAITCLVVSACATRGDESDKPTSKPQAETPANQAAQAKEAAAPAEQRATEAAPAQTAAAQPAAPVTDGPVHKPPEGAQLKSGKEVATTTAELESTCSEVCKKVTSCMPANATFSNGDCSKSCNSAPADAALRPALDFMKNCAGKSDCKAFNDCMGSRSSSAPPK